MIGISATMFSDLIHGRRTLSFEVARNIHKVLGIPAEVMLASLSLNRGKSEPLLIIGRELIRQLNIAPAVVLGV